MRFLFVALFMLLATHVSAQESLPNQDVKQAPAQTDPAKETAVQPSGAEPRVEAVAPAQPPKEEHNQGTADDIKCTPNNVLFWGDGVAQWVMAITGIVALGVSAWAVWLVRRSLVLTREAVAAAEGAVAVTREMGEAQTRAYLTVAGGTAVFKGGTEPEVLIRIKNAGNARLYRKGKGKETKLCFMGHGWMENRHGLLVDACLTLAHGHAEWVAALHMIEPRADRPQAISLGADKAYDAEDFVNELRSMRVTPHVAQNMSGRSSAIHGRTTRHRGYAVSQRIRKRIEEAFGWIKVVAGQHKTRFRGRDHVGWAFTFAAAAYNLVRLPKLMAETG